MFLPITIILHTFRWLEPLELFWGCLECSAGDQWKCVISCCWCLREAEVLTLCKTLFRYHLLVGAAEISLFSIQEGGQKEINYRHMRNETKSLTTLVNLQNIDDLFLPHLLIVWSVRIFACDMYGSWHMIGANMKVTLKGPGPLKNFCSTTIKIVKAKVIVISFL